MPPLNKRCIGNANNLINSTVFNRVNTVNWTFAFHQKDNWVFFWTFFSIIKLFLSFVVFARFATTQVTNDAISPQKCGIQHRVISSVCHLELVTLWCRWTDVCTDGWKYVRTDGHVTITSLSKFLALIGSQICLAMVLCWCTSARALPLFIAIIIIILVKNLLHWYVTKMPNPLPS